MVRPRPSGVLLTFHNLPEISEIAVADDHDAVPVLPCRCDQPGLPVSDTVKAGISRPALYLLSPDKEPIFDRVIRKMDARKLAEICASTAKICNLQEKLSAACVDRDLHAVEVVAAHPDAADLFDLRFPAVRKAYADFETVIAAMIAVEVERSGISARLDPPRR